jgi:hypothetical protein
MTPQAMKMTPQAMKMTPQAMKMTPQAMKSNLYAKVSVVKKLSKHDPRSWSDYIAYFAYFEEEFGGNYSSINVNTDIQSADYRFRRFID